MITYQNPTPNKQKTRANKNSTLTSAIALSLSIASTALMANPTPTIIGCSPGATPATVALTMQANTSIGLSGESICPLLEKRRLRKFVNKKAAGSVFAYPLIPYTCLTSSISSGSILLGTTAIELDPSASYAESAHRLFPVPLDQAPLGLGGLGFSANSVDGTLQAVSALTILHLQGSDNNGNTYTFDILANDNSLTTHTGEDTEEFLIIGSRGEYKVKGRLVGRGQLLSLTPVSLAIEVSGTMCVSN